MNLRRCFAFLLVFGCASACVAADPGAGFHVVKYTLELTPDLGTKSVAGVETIQLRSLTDSLQNIVFSANALSIDSATLNGQTVQVSKSDDALSFDLTQPLPPNSAATLRIEYHGKPKRGIVFGENSVYTTYFACDWMVCPEDAPGDKALFALDLHVPFGMTSLAVGKLTSTTKLKEGKQIDHWRTAIPYSAYLYDFAVGRFNIARDRGPSGELSYWSETATPAEMQTLFIDTRAMVEWLSEKAGMGLPAKSYAQLLVPGKEAQEAATYSIIGRDYLVPDDDWVIVHELAHQWWGNLVTCKTWQDFWLNEGITSFMVDAWKEQHYGKDAYTAGLARTKKGLDDLLAKGMKDYPLAYGGQYANIRERRAIQYGKGELFMAHLRTLLGEDAFWAGLQRYTREHAGGTVTSIDFERAMEKASGKDLHEEFAKWVFVGAS